MADIKGNVRVAKFGGSSLADAAHFSIIKSIFENSSANVLIIPSAPGKRNSSDTKVTDMLISLYARLRLLERLRTRRQRRHIAATSMRACSASKLPTLHISISALFCAIYKRYDSIAQELSIAFDAKSLLQGAVLDVRAAKSSGMRDYFVSRGEYMCARLLAEYLGYEFIDAKDVVFFDSDGKLKLDDTIAELRSKTKHIAHAVIPGFYGSEHFDDRTLGRIVTFTRGGSDVTGALVARAANAAIYENWTDVSGFFAADPRIVPDAVTVPELNYAELRELSCMGASVLHGSTVVPLMKTDIKINVRNTNDVTAHGTMISRTTAHNRKIAGIAGKPGYTAVTVRKLELGDDRHFVRMVLHAFEACSVPVEHMPLSMDNVSFVTRTDAYRKHESLLRQELDTILGGVEIETNANIALIAVVSSTLSRSPKFAHVVFMALADADIELRMIDHGSGSNSIVIGVDEEHCTAAIRAIYTKFLEHDYIQC